MPPPTHMVTIPYRAFRRFISRMMVAVSLAPVHPSGCPKAMAPPLGFTRSGSSPASWITASDCAAKASFNSITSMSSKLQPCHLQRLRNREHRAEAHIFGLVSRRGKSNIARQRLDSQRLRPFCGHDNRGGRAIGSLRRVARSHGAFGVKGRLECEQGFHRGVGARAFIDLEDDFLPLRLRCHWAW